MMILIELITGRDDYGFGLDTSTSVIQEVESIYDISDQYQVNISYLGQKREYKINKEDVISLKVIK